MLLVLFPARSNEPDVMAPGGLVVSLLCMWKTQSRTPEYFNLAHDKVEAAAKCYTGSVPTRGWATETRDIPH